MTSNRVQTWIPEDVVFWESQGKNIAKENLFVSTIALTLSFAIWQLWATIAIHLNSIGFHLSDNELFTLAALPGLVGATCRLVYTYMPSILGGRTWTIISTAILIIPVIGLGNALQDPTTSYDTLFFLVSLCGVAGGNFSSSMANIGNFYPRIKKGTALGINGGVGNLGVSLIYFIAPLAMTTSIFKGIFGNPQVTKAGTEIYLQNIVYIWLLPIIITIVLAYYFMDNLPNVKQSPKSILALFKKKHTWIMTWIYTCCFGSFIGFSAALSLLVNKEFPEISFTFAAFLGPFIGACIRPFGGWLSDKIDSGAKVTFYAFIVLLLSTIGVIFFIQAHQFIPFFICFLILFAMTGLANGSTFRMIPNIFNAQQSSLASGFTAAIAAYGAFGIPKIFGWSYSAFKDVSIAFYLLIAYYVITIFLTYYYYARKNAEVKC